MAVIERFRDRAGREVVLTDAGRAHILGRRPRMAGQLDQIPAAVETSEVVTRDRKYPRRENHYRRMGDLYLKVVVNYGPVPPDGTQQGTVITAHPVREIDPREDWLWP